MASVVTRRVPGTMPNTTSAAAWVRTTWVRSACSWVQHPGSKIAASKACTSPPSLPQHARKIPGVSHGFPSLPHCRSTHHMGTLPPLLTPSGRSTGSSMPEISHRMAQRQHCHSLAAQPAHQDDSSSLAPMAGRRHATAGSRRAALSVTAAAATASSSSSRSTSTPISSSNMGNGRSFFLETYGCQMNVNDSEVVASILVSAGYSPAARLEDADVILLNTCAIRESAESRIWGRLTQLRGQSSIWRSQQQAAATAATAASRGGDVAAAAQGAVSTSSSVSSPSPLQASGSAGVSKSGCSGSCSSGSSSATATRPTVPSSSHSSGGESRVTMAASKPGPVVLGVLGCMAERVKEKLLDRDRLADVVVGPDAYRDLPALLAALQGADPCGHDWDVEEEDEDGWSPGGPSASRGTRGSSGSGSSKGAMNVQLSVEETYADIRPLRPAGRVSAFLSIMRGCNNMCAFCVVPFTRGRERSRPAASILAEVRELAAQGVRDITLLGQNVNSYADFEGLQADEGAGLPPGPAPSAASASASSATAGAGQGPEVYASGFSSVYRPRREGALTFAQLLAAVAEAVPEVRIRFTSPHPKDFNDDVLRVIATYPNVCKHLHMPAQSGSSSVLQRMRRGYSREAYDALLARARQIIPHVAIATDIIVGFCGESEAEHAETLDLMARAGYGAAYMFAYSKRDKTYAARHMEDDVPQEVKDRRLQEVMEVFKQALEGQSRGELGRVHLVLVEGLSRKHPGDWVGRTCTNKKVVMRLGQGQGQGQMWAPSLATLLQPGAATANDAAATAMSLQQQQGGSGSSGAGLKAAAAAADGGVAVAPGEYLAVAITGYSHSTLRGVPLARTSIAEFHRVFGSTVVDSARASEIQHQAGMSVSA